MPAAGSVCASVIATPAIAALVIQDLAPLSIQPPVVRSARVLMPLKSLPCAGSVYAAQPMSSPASILGSSRAAIVGCAAATRSRAL